MGPPPLGTRILDPLEHRPDRLVIVSDGWDSAPPGLAGEVLRVRRARIDPHRRTAVVHVNPVYEADGFDVRRLAPSVPTADVRDAEDLPALLEMAQFAEARGGAGALHARPDRQVSRFVNSGGRTDKEGEQSEQARPDRNHRPARPGVGRHPAGTPGTRCAGRGASAASGGPP